MRFVLLLDMDCYYLLVVGVGDEVIDVVAVSYNEKNCYDLVQVTLDVVVDSVEVMDLLVFDVFDMDLIGRYQQELYLYLVVVNQNIDM